MDAWMGPNHEMCVLCVYVIIVYESNNVQLVLMTTSECMNQVFVWQYMYNIMKSGQRLL